LNIKQIKIFIANGFMKQLKKKYWHGSILGGSPKSEGFGDGYTAFGALPSPSCAHSTSLRAGFEAATQD